ncbi:hypothetical protein V8C86DRAFT_171574 [Haematococcus lacustris]
MHCRQHTCLKSSVHSAPFSSLSVALVCLWYGHACPAMLGHDSCGMGHVEAVRLCRGWCSRPDAFFQFSVPCAMLVPKRCGCHLFRSPGWSGFSCGDEWIPASHLEGLEAWVGWVVTGVEEEVMVVAPGGRVGLLVSCLQTKTQAMLAHTHTPPSTPHILTQDFSCRVLACRGHTTCSVLHRWLVTLQAPGGAGLLLATPGRTWHTGRLECSVSVHCQTSRRAGNRATGYNRST